MQEICERAKQEFVQFIDSTVGPKDLVIQSKQLMSLLEHVTPMKVLRRYGVWLYIHCNVALYAFLIASRLNIFTCSNQLWKPAWRHVSI